MCCSASRKTARALAVGNNAVKQADETEESFEKDLNCDFEKALEEESSKKLYGLSTPTYELENLANMLRKKRLNLFPEYQREYVWKVDRASRLVVTVLCNRLVPNVVFHEKKKGVFDVVDGKQRLSSLLSFLLADDNEHVYQNLPPFHQLAKLDDDYAVLNGLRFQDLTLDRQNAFEAYTISASVIPHDTPKHDVFSVYEDINSGGEELKPQQLRRAVFYGPYIKLLDRLAANDDFQHIRDPKAKKLGKYELDSKDADREMILRAFAFHRQGAGRAKSFKPPIKKFLNVELQEIDAMPYEVQEREMKLREEEFTLVVRVAREVFGEGAFRKWEKKDGGGWEWGNTVSMPLWDCLYSALAELLIEEKQRPVVFTQNASRLQQEVQRLFEEQTPELEDLGRTTAAKLAVRRDLLKNTIRGLLSKPPNGSVPVLNPRLFQNQRELRPKLFEKQRGLCAICGEMISEDRVHEGDYAQLDHIKPHSKGGLSTEENAQLVHARCNASKGANEEYVVNG